ncbi:MAG: radical SAM protein [Deltaproteobacteria bacterium]|nr:radical SAM protein [Deltaproteobacteria bacterium]
MYLNKREGIFPVSMVNITNRCNLRCKHCFIFRDGNPNQSKAEMDDDTMVQQLQSLRKEHHIEIMLWMGGEPLLRPEVLRKGLEIFDRNTITTNGTMDLIDFPGCTYVISLDGPPDINDLVRGKGSFDKVMKTLSRIPKNFGSTVMVQCVVTMKNEDRLEELAHILAPTRAEGLTFSFYVPPKNDRSDLTWGSLERRDRAVQEVMRLKRAFPGFIWNSGRSLELTLSQNALKVTRDCPLLTFAVPLYLEADRFVSPFCCYGNDVDCDLCGAWVVFSLAEKIERSPTNDLSNIPEKMRFGEGGTGFWTK